MMSNEELLARIDERLNATNENLAKIYQTTISMDKRLRDVEINIRLIENEVKKIPVIESELSNVKNWKTGLSGSWKATVIISIVLSFIVNAIISYFKGD